MNCKEIVTDYLKANGFGGLYNPDAECGCDIDDLAPCWDCYSMLQCEPAYRVEGRCKTCESHCDGYDPDGPGICYTIQKPEAVVHEEEPDGQC